MSAQPRYAPGEMAILYRWLAKPSLKTCGGNWMTWG
jgi:hypothetical protein